MMQKNRLTDTTMAADNSRFYGHAKDKERTWQRNNGPSFGCG
jgi:hypothetical protein